VDKAWRRQNPQEYTSERWNYMWPSSVKREGRRYGWKDGRPFIFASEPKPPPTQASFGGSPPKPPGNALKPGATVRKGPRQVTLSDAEAEARRNLRNARSQESRNWDKTVMADNRDELRAHYAANTRKAEEELIAVQQRERAARVGRIQRRQTYRAIAKHPATSILGIGAAGTGLAVGYNALAPRKYKEPADTSAPDYYWKNVATKDKEIVGEMQTALDAWGVWPTEDRTLPNGAKVKSKVPQTGTFGRVTRDAVKRWRYERGMDPDGVMTRADIERLLAGPKGFQTDDGAWSNSREASVR
jgi:hypothetical protein